MYTTCVVWHVANCGVTINLPDKPRTDSSIATPVDHAQTNHVVGLVRSKIEIPDQ